MNYTKLISLFLIIIPFTSFINSSSEIIYGDKNQNQEVIYSLNEYGTSNIVKQGQVVPWGTPKRAQSSYILIKQKPDGLTYLQVTIGGQFAYGGYFKYLGKEGNDYTYIRTDVTAKEDFLYINYPLTVLSESQKYDESIVMKMLNYQTSYGMLFKF